MMRSIILLCCVGAAFGQTFTLPNHHDLRTLLNRAFGRLDQDQSGDISEAEFDMVIVHDDANKDGNVTLAEYQAAHSHMPAEISGPLFNFFDPDHNGVHTVSDMQTEYHLMDHNKNGELTMQEFDNYMIKQLEALFGQHGHAGR
ncbi:insoluble matrix shell protein 5-like [Mya arenaria]|uniref:insoluble matrix shell protein 5-like n=1 Tax=Mya arenaria TaxID=6604 RepID=UPI0022E961F7|nr:insoluble matrix shell protein 5-like [Mya arenaria]